MDESKWIRFCGLASLLGGLLEIGVRIPYYVLVGIGPVVVGIYLWRHSTAGLEGER